MPFKSKSGNGLFVFLIYRAPDMAGFNH
jgi:hypothetical protein